MPSNSEENKLLGRQILDYSQVEEAVKKTNSLLSSQGGNVNLDLTTGFKKQINDLYKSIETTAKQSASNLSASMQGANIKMEEIEGTAKRVLNVITSIGKDGSIRRTTTYLNELGQKCKDVEESGQLVSRSIASIGTEGKKIKEFKTILTETKSLMQEWYSIQIKMSSMDTKSSEYQNLEERANSIRENIENNKEQLLVFGDLEEEINSINKQQEEEEGLQRKIREAQDKSKQKSKSNDEREALNIINEQTKLLGQIHSMKQQLISASENEKEALSEEINKHQARYDLLDDQLDVILKQNAELLDQDKIQKSIMSRDAKKLINSQKEQRLEEKIVSAKKQQKDFTEKIQNALLNLVTVSTIVTFWKNAIEYSSKYYDQLNEIRIVTKATEEEAFAMGEAYRKMADSMNVSSTEIASAAVEFWRQGLDESEVNQRLVNTTQYAKISGQAFKEAAELVTAATNSMSLDSQRVVDVFSYLGDASSSGADEIGIAMQKASASAQEAGVSFEWLGAYIATVSEKTRQAPESIGTAFNSLMSRLQSIKKNGFNEEDSTKINDVANALHSVGIELMTQDGEWRNMSDIFLDIAEKWGTMDDKARSYLATTMAGTRQKNVFLTLMNDMSLMSENTDKASRALELYYGALESAGAASEKYAIYQESIAAAKADLKNSLEELYAELADSGVIKSFYKKLTEIVDGFKEATEGSGKFAIALGMVGAALGGLTLGYRAEKSLDPKTTQFGFLASNKTKLIILGTSAAVIALATAIGKLKKISEEKNAPLDYSASITSTQNTITNVRTLRDEYKTLLETENRTAIQEERMHGIVSSLAGMNDELAESLKDTNGQYLEGASALEVMNTALEGYLSNLNALSNAQAIQNFQDKTGVETALYNYEKSQSVKAIRDSLPIVKEHIGENATEKEIFDKISELSRIYAGGHFDQDWSAVKPLIEDWEKSLLDSWHESGILYQGLYDFFGDYKGTDQDVLDIVTALKMHNTKDEENDARKEVEEWLENYVVTLMNSDDYSKLSAQAQAAVQKLAESYVSSLRSDELNVDNLYDIERDGVGYFDEAFEKLKTINGLFDEYKKKLKESNPEDPEAAFGLIDLKEQIDALIKDFSDQTGIKFPLLDEQLALEGVSSESGEELEKQEAQIKGFYDSLKKEDIKKQISDKSQAGWKSEIEQIGEILNSTDADKADKIREMIIEFSNPDNSEWISQMKQDLPFLEQMLQSFFDDAGNIMIDDESISKAIEIWTNGLKDADKEALEFKSTIDSIRETLDLTKARDNGWADQLAEMSKFISEFGDQKLYDKFGLGQWFRDLDPSIFQGMTTDFDWLKEFVAEHLKQLEDGRWIIEAEVSDWEELDEKIRQAQASLSSYYTTKQKELGSQVDNDRGREMMGDLYSTLSTEGPEAYYKAIENLSDAEREWLADNSEGHKEMIKLWGKEELSIGDCEDALEKFGKEIQDIDIEKLAEDGKTFEEFPDWFDSCIEGGMGLHDTLAEVTTKMDTLTKAQGYLTGLQNGTITSTEHVTEALEFLSSVTGYSTDRLNNDLSPAIAWLASQSGATSNMVYVLKNAIQATGAVNFSTAGWRAELNALANDAGNAYSGIAQLLQIILDADSVLNNKGTVTVPKFKGGGGGGGGGGSSGGSSNEMSEIEKMLDLMEQIQEIRDHQRDVIQRYASYYESRGELQGVIKFYEQEKAAIQDNNGILEENIRRIEELITIKQREIAQMDTSDKGYEQAAKDLEALQKTHRQYTLDLLDNRNAIEDLNKAIKDQQDKIRDMEIDLRNTILEAIKDREELQERMLKGTIEVEDEIFNVIKARYERERDLAIESAEARIKALQQESEELDKQFQQRKKQAEQEDKRLKLQQLQAQLARISADPTRRKEELELRKEIEDLREEMAWDLAEDEVEAEKDSIAQRITSLEDYIEQVEQYYEDLFEHPQQLLAEVQEIMSRTDEEIINFLIRHNEEYQTSSEARQRDMVNNWNKMLMDMRGETENYWDEVEEIIKQGDAAIIQFLQQHSADYRNAGKQQAEAYVEEWQKKLTDLRNAYKEISDEITNFKYITIDPPKNDNNNGGGGGGGGGGGSGNGGGKGGTGGFTEPISYSFKFKNYLGTWSAAYTDESQALAFNKAKKAAISHWNGKKYDKDGKLTPGVSDVLRLLANASAYNPGSYIKQFAKGGLANFTGPAWLDGSMSAPERILSPYQTKLFEDMISTLHHINISSPSIPAGIWSGSAQDVQTISFGDIILNIDQLSDDMDIQNMVDRIMDEITEKMSRGMAVGGIRITR